MMRGDNNSNQTILMYIRTSRNKCCVKISFALSFLLVIWDYICPQSYAYHFTQQRRCAHRTMEGLYSSSHNLQQDMSVYIGPKTMHPKCKHYQGKNRRIALNVKSSHVDEEDVFEEYFYDNDDDDDSFAVDGFEMKKYQLSKNDQGTQYNLL